METRALLKRLSEASGVSGYESEVRAIVVEEFGRYADEVHVDRLGNVIALKRGEELVERSSRHSIMLAGHMDEIGLIVTDIEKGFLRFTSVGGLDTRTLLGQEVVVHGSRPVPGMVASRPPHVVPAEERRKPIPMDKLFIDVGLPDEQVRQLIRAGDLVTVQRDFVELGEGRVAGKALDNRTSLVVIAGCLELLTTQRHTWDVCAVATVQEEVGFKGAITSTYDLSPDVGIALDVTFGDMPGVSEAETVELEAGPAIAFGPNIHPRLHEALTGVAQKHEIRYQIEPIPAGSGTDGWVMQITRAGIPTALVSIPLRNMHTSVEMLGLKDVDRASRLLAAFIAGLDDGFLETLRWDTGDQRG